VLGRYVEVMLERGAALTVVLFACTACTGNIEDPGAHPRGEPGPGGGGGAGAGAGGAMHTARCGVSEGPFRRITRREYDNTVRDLFGDASGLAGAFPAEDEQAGFALGGTVTALSVESYQGAAEAIAARAVGRIGATERCDPVAEGERTCAARVELERLLACDPGVGAGTGTAAEDACAARLVDELGGRVYRRPLDGEMRARLLAVFSAARGGAGYAHGIEVVIAAMLQSPWFLYVVELGDPAVSSAPGDVVPLDGWSRSSRLSYLLWDTMPDAELLAAADAGALASPDGIEAQARRMLDDPRAREAVSRFFVEWLHLDVAGLTKDATLFPEFDDAVWDAMLAETRAFVDWAVWEDGTLDALLTATHGAAAGERAGVLTQPSVLTAMANPDETSPILRGLLVRERLFCQSLPSPPADIPPLPEPTATTTTRQRLEEQHVSPECAGCHELIDPIGFTFERYDAIGRLRATDNGYPIDDAGYVAGTPSSDAELTGAIELAQHLAQSEDVRRCIGKQWFRYAFARLERGDDDGCSLDATHQQFEASGWDLRELLIALVRSDAFLFRRIGAGEEI
jgi:hypothetical protein